MSSRVLDDIIDQHSLELNLKEGNKFVPLRVLKIVDIEKIMLTHTDSESWKRIQEDCRVSEKRSELLAVKKFIQYFS